MVGRVAAGVLMLSVFVAIPATAQELPWAFILKGNLTTSSQIYFNPNAPDPIDRSAFNDVTDFFGFGAELKYQIPETYLAISISADRVRARAEHPLLDPPGPYIPVADGYDATSVELSGYFIIPASGTTFGIFMGGGLGVYFGHRFLSWGGAEAQLVDSKAGFGIHVLTGVSIRFARIFSLIGEMKFRDLQFQSSNRFSAASIDYQGTEVRLPGETLESNVHTDGITFQVGVAFNF